MASFLESGRRFGSGVGAVSGVAGKGGSRDLAAVRFQRAWKGDVLAEDVVGTEEIVPGLIVRHTSRRLGNLEDSEACERLVSGSISFSEFIDQIGDGYKEILDFMMDHDLHPGRLGDVVFCIDCHAEPEEREALVTQIGQIYNQIGASGAGYKITAGTT